MFQGVLRSSSSGQFLALQWKNKATKIAAAGPIMPSFLLLINEDISCILEECSLLLIYVILLWSYKQCDRKHLSTMSNSQSYNGYSSEIRECRCKLPAIVITLKTNKNPGRKFWRCPIYKREHKCGYFECLDIELCDKGQDIMNGSVRKILKVSQESQHL